MAMRSTSIRRDRRLPRDLARLFDLQIKIYNPTFKIQKTHAALLRFFLWDDPVLLMALLDRCFAGRINDASTRPSNNDVFGAFLSTQVLNGLDHVANGRPVKVLMSLIDHMDRDRTVVVVRHALFAAGGDGPHNGARTGGGARQPPAPAGGSPPVKPSQT